MGADHLPDDFTLSEAQFRKIIELAARLPAPRDGVTLTQLRQIAAELDIDPEALAGALSAVLATTPDRRFPRRWWSSQALRIGLAMDRFLPGKWRLATLATLGGFLGWLDAVVGLGMRRVVSGMTIMTGSTSYLVIAIAVFLSCLTLANSFSRRLNGGRRRYLVETAVTWGSLALAWALTHGSATDDLLRFLAWSLAGSALWGWWIIRPAGGPHARLAGEAATPAPGSPGARVEREDGSDDRRLARIWLAHSARTSAT